jgi:hypothetical protein
LPHAFIGLSRRRREIRFVTLLPVVIGFFSSFCYQIARIVAVSSSSFSYLWVYKILRRIVIVCIRPLYVLRLLCLRFPVIHGSRPYVKHALLAVVAFFFRFAPLSFYPTSFQAA